LANYESNENCLKIPGLQYTDPLLAWLSPTIQYLCPVAKRGIDEHLYRCNWYTNAVMQITTNRDEERYGGVSFEWTRRKTRW
jgi:hypothetical protein